MLRGWFPPGDAYARCFCDDEPYEGISVCIGTYAFEDTANAPGYTYKVYVGKKDARWSPYHTFAVCRESGSSSRFQRNIPFVHNHQGRSVMGDALHPDGVQDPRDASATYEHVVAASDLEDPASTYLRGRVVHSTLCLFHGRR